jgi:hypothetical protein
MSIIGTNEKTAIIGLRRDFISILPLPLARLEKADTDTYHTYSDRVRATICLDNKR